MIYCLVFCKICYEVWCFCGAYTLSFSLFVVDKKAMASVISSPATIQALAPSVTDLATATAATPTIASPPPTPDLTALTKTYTGDYTIYDNVRKVLIYMRDTFIKENNRTIYLGSGLRNTALASGSDIPAATDAMNALVFGYDYFRQYYNASLPLSADVAMLMTNVYVRAAGTDTYRLMTDADINTDRESFKKEINYSRVLTYPNPMPASPPPNLLADLNKVRNAYTFLKDNNLKSFKSGNDNIKVSNYMVPIPTPGSAVAPTDYKTETTLTDAVVADIWDVLIGGARPTITANGASTNDFNKMKQQLRQYDVVENDVFIIRRMLLLFELMANIYISMYLYDKYNTLTQDTGDAKKAKQITFIKNISNTAQMLIGLNETFSKSTEPGSQRSVIIQDLRKNIRKYLSSSNDINELDASVFRLKTEMAGNQSLYNGTAGTRRKAAAYEKTIIAMFVVFVVILLGVAIYPMPKPVKTMIALGMLVLVVFFASILTNLFRKRLERFENMDEDEEFEDMEEAFEDVTEDFEDMEDAAEDFEDMEDDDEGFEDMEDDEEGFEDMEEGFAVGAGEYLITPANISAVQDANAVVKTLMGYNRAFVGEALDYLNISLYIGITLQSSQSYKSMNDTMNREIGYFDQMKQMIDNNNNKLSGAASVNQLDAITSRARANFFIQMGVLIAIGVVAYIMFGDNPSVQPYVFAVIGLIILLLVFIYMHEVSKRVRTDGQKFYWRQPSNLSVLDNA